MAYFLGISYLVLGLAGVLGWYYAMRGWRESEDVGRQLAAAKSETETEKRKTFTVEARALTAEARASAMTGRAEQLELALAAERQSRQNLIDVLARSGNPNVAPVVVDSALDELYKDGDGRAPGADPGARGNPPGVSAVAARASTKTPPG